jgi:hypothetical protein
MGKVRLTSTHKKGISIAAIAIVTLMLVDAVYQIGVHVAWRRWLPEALAARSPTTQPAQTQPADTQPANTQPADKAKAKKPSKPPEIHAAIKKRNIFTKVKPKGHGMKLTGVIGRIALFKKGDQTVGIEEGESGHGIKVVSIKDYEVTIEHEGKSETMKLFSGSSADRGGRPGPDREGPSPASLEAAKTATTATQPSAPEAPAAVETTTVPEKARRALMRTKTRMIRTKTENGSVVIERDGEATMRVQEEP